MAEKHPLVGRGRAKRSRLSIPRGGGLDGKEAAGVIVNDSLDVIEFLGHTDRYLELASGKARLNLLKMARPGLRPELFRAIEEAKRCGRAVRKPRLRIRIDGRLKEVNLEVTCVNGQNSRRPSFQVLFEEGVSAVSSTQLGRTGLGQVGSRSGEATVRRSGAEKFKQQLSTTKEVLESIIEEHEITTKKLKTAYDELKTANEKLQASHEELRATMAELETSNAELRTVNLQLKVAIIERERAEEERRRLEAKVRQAQKLESLGVLAGGIAHDFNNLLVSVIGNAGLALEELALDSAARPFVEEVEKAGQRAAELTKQLLAYSGKGSFLVEPINFSELVQEMAHLLDIAVSKRAKVDYHFADNLPFIEADATQIRQVVMNLITNAAEATGDKNGTIHVMTGVTEGDRAYLSETVLDEDLPEGHYAYLEVSDSGCGMDEGTKGKIFDPFFTTKFTGRGLGLAAVLGIVRGHQGAIRVESQLGRGTRFRVLFPISAQQPRQAGVEAAAACGWLGSGTVLVVDDEANVRKVASAMLGRAGFTVLTAADGGRAAELFEAHSEKTVVVLLDLTMPGMDGEEAYHRIRRIRPDIPIIISSGYNEEDAASRFAGQRVAGFIHKPYRPGELIQKVRDVLQRASGPARLVAAVAERPASKPDANPNKPRLQIR